MQIDPKEQYVRIDSWGSLMIPLKFVHMLEKAAVVDSEFRDGRYHIKLKKGGGPISFVMVPKEDVVAALAALRLEE